MRRGELLGLRWQVIDLDLGRLQVRQNLISVDYKLVFSRPKTARSNSSIALDPATCNALRAHRKAQLEERLAWGPPTRTRGSPSVGKTALPSILNL
jgi:integrase